MFGQSTVTTATTTPHLRQPTATVLIFPHPATPRDACRIYTGIWRVHCKLEPKVASDAYSTLLSPRTQADNPGGHADAASNPAS